MFNRATKLQDAAANNQIENKLLDRVIEFMHLKNDAALSRALNVTPTVISKTRHGRLPITSGMIIRIHELTNWPVASIFKMLERETPLKRAA